MRYGMKVYSWRSLSITERAEALNYIEALKSETPEQIRDKAILNYFVKDNMCASAISRLDDARIVGFGNRSKNKPLSPTSILRRIYEHFPEWKGRQMSQNVSDKNRLELIRKREKQESPHVKSCAFCGSIENLEEHHMIPLSMGGTNDDNNLIYLCHQCHKKVTKYQNKIRQEYRKIGTNEEWKLITDLDGKYEVSTLGNIRNTKTKKLKAVVFDGHYWKFGFDYYFEGKEYRGWYRVHKAVAEAFIPNPDKKPTVNHIDGDHANNAVENLEWATHKEQTDHMHSVLKIGCCENSIHAKFTNDEVKTMREKYKNGVKVKELSQIYGVPHSTISMIVHYKKWKHL